jgi:hypothetical protein
MPAPGIETYVGKTMPNGLTVLQLLPQNAHSVRKYWLRCPYDQKEFSAPVGQVLRGERKGCGCQGGRRKPAIQS